MDIVILVIGWIIGFGGVIYMGAMLKKHNYNNNKPVIIMCTCIGIMWILTLVSVLMG